MAPMPLSMDELARAAKLVSGDLIDKVSAKGILSLSYEAGGLYPTLVGYALGAIATLCFVGCSSWLFRTAPVALCLLAFVLCLQSLGQTSFAWLLTFGAITGGLCTYVQASSWKLAFAHIENKRKEKLKMGKKLE